MNELERKIENIVTSYCRSFSRLEKPNGTYLIQWQYNNGIPSFEISLNGEFLTTKDNVNGAKEFCENHSKEVAKNRLN